MENSTRTSASGGAGEPLTEQAKRQTHQVVKQTKQKASEALNQAGSQIKSRLEGQKEVAVSGLETVALAVRQTGQNLRRQEQDALGGHADGAAEIVENLSGYLRRTDLDEFVVEAEIFARRRPALFLGGVFALGFLAARFLKSSGQDESRSGDAANITVTDAPARQEVWRGEIRDDTAASTIF